MPEELQSLLSKIQKDGVEKAEAESEKIISEAKRKADKIVEDAKNEAERIIEAGRKEAESFSENAKKSVEQAARDVVLSVGQSVQSAMQSLIDAKVDDAFDDKLLEEMLTRFVEVYFSEAKNTKGVKVIVSEKDEKRITAFFMDKFKKKMSEGIEIGADNSVVSGFRVAIKDDQLEHDFSKQAIVEALSDMLRPRLAELVKKSIKEDQV